MTIAFVISFLLLTFMVTDVVSQDTDLFDELEIITLDNVDKLQEIGVIGMGILNDRAVSPDGKWAIIASSYGLWFYNLSQIVPEPQWVNLKVNQIEFTPDGDQVVMAHDYNQLILWDMSTMTVTSIVSAPVTGDSFSDKRATRLKMANDGTILTTHFDELAYIWLGQDYQNFQEINISQFIALQDIDFGIDSSQLVFTSHRFFGIYSWQKDERLVHENEVAIFLSTIPNSPYLLREPQPNKLNAQLLDLVTGEFVSPQIGHITEAGYDQNELILVSHSPLGQKQSRVSRLDPNAGWYTGNSNKGTAELQNATHLSPSSFASFQLEKNRYVSRLHDGAFTIWDIETGKLIHTIDVLGFNMSFTDKSDIVISPNGKWLVTHDGDMLNRQIWNIFTGQPLSLPVDNLQFVPYSFSDDSQKFVSKRMSPQYDWHIIVANVEGGEVRSFNITDDYFDLLGFSGDDHLIWQRHAEFFPYVPPTIQITDLTGEITSRFEMDSDQFIYGVNHYLGYESGYVFGLIKGHRDEISVIPIWDANSSMLLNQIEVETEEPAHIYINGKIKRLGVTTQENELKIWDFVTGEKIATIPTSQHADIAYTSDGLLLAMFSPSGLTVYETGNYSYQHVIEGAYAVAISSDDKMLVVGNEDGTLHVWGVTNGDLPLIPPPDCLIDTVDCIPELESL